MNLKSLTPKITAHFKATIEAKGFDPRTVIATLKNPTEVYPSGKRYPGQWRVTGNGLCIVGKPEGDTFILITIYLDRVLTDCRADQLGTAQGREYAARRAQGLGRGC